jgi:hypothetical protein
MLSAYRLTYCGHLLLVFPLSMLVVRCCQCVKYRQHSMQTTDSPDPLIVCMPCQLDSRLLVAHHCLISILRCPCLHLLQRLAWCLGSVGALLLVRKAAKHAYVRYKEHQARERVRKALARIAQGDSSNAAGQSGPSTSSAAAGLDAAEAGLGGSSSRDAGVCVVCLSAPSEMVYVRCGHMCCCVRCSQVLGAKRCPVCRAEGSVIKVFRT